jgi:hypothetical protein
MSHLHQKRRFPDLAQSILVKPHREKMFEHFARNLSKFRWPVSLAIDRRIG